MAGIAGKMASVNRSTEHLGAETIRSDERPIYMPKFRKKPVVIEAVQITRPMTVETLEGVMRGEPTDWLITGVKGEQYFCKNDIFLRTYEPAEPEPEPSGDRPARRTRVYKSKA
jgi:hypothetical protein